MIAVLIGVMLQARQAIERRGIRNGKSRLIRTVWMDVVADPLGRVGKQTSGQIECAVSAAEAVGFKPPRPRPPALG
jgi:hypothetical protein